MSGIIPFGFRLGINGRTLDAHDAEQGTLAIIQGLRAEGLSLRAIAETLNAQGTLTRAGTPWLFEYVRRALKQLKKADRPAA